MKGKAYPQQQSPFGPDTCAAPVFPAVLLTEGRQPVRDVRAVTASTVGRVRAERAGAPPPGVTVEATAVVAASIVERAGVGAGAAVLADCGIRWARIGAVGSDRQRLPLLRELRRLQAHPLGGDHALVVEDRHGHRARRGAGARGDPGRGCAAEGVAEEAEPESSLWTDFTDFLWTWAVLVRPVTHRVVRHAAVKTEAGAGPRRYYLRGGPRR